MRECRFHRTPKLGSSGAGSETCEKGIAYASLLPTPEARGSGWVRRLPCAQLGAMPRLPGGCDCPHYVEKTEHEHFADYEPLRRIGDALEREKPTPEQIRTMNADKPALEAYFADRQKLTPGAATLERTAEHVSLVCACGARTALPRDVGPAFACASCGKGYRLRFVHAAGDYRLVADP